MFFKFGLNYFLVYLNCIAHISRMFNMMMNDAFLMLCAFVRKSANFCSVRMEYLLAAPVASTTLSGLASAVSLVPPRQKLQPARRLREFHA